MAKKDKRFVVKSEDSLGELGMAMAKVIVDTFTGVNYLVTISGGVAGVNTCVIPLLDKNGKVIVDELPVEN